MPISGREKIKKDLFSPERYSCLAVSRTDKEIVIIGGGISGLSALHYIKQLAPERTVTLYEAESRLGGTIGTDLVDGYSFDWGPNGFLDREPLTLNLCKDIGLNDQLERAGQNVSKRFVLRSGKLRSVPTSPPAFLKSDILSLRGKLRLLFEPFAKSAPINTDESIYDFGCRRIGREAADYLIQPMVSGIFGGMADRLSLESCFPIMTKMESEHGSLFKAMIAKGKIAKEKKRAENSNTTLSGSPADRPGPAGPAGWLTSFNGGIHTLVDKLQMCYQENIMTNQPVKLIVRKPTGTYAVHFDNGSVVTTTKLIVATPAGAAAKLSQPLSQTLSEALQSIPYAPIAVVCFGYDSDKVSSDLNGFGFLVPKKEKRRILGSIWTSSIFSGRAPSGHVQLRTMIGGDGDHESMNLSNQELIQIVFDELSDIVGLEGQPAITRIYRWNEGIPQYKIGHKKILDQIEIALNSLGNIYLTGNAYYGVGLNDCIKLSHRVVAKVMQVLA